MKIADLTVAGLDGCEDVAWKMGGNDGNSWPGVRSRCGIEPWGL